MCGLRNISQIHQWASNQRVSSFLKEHFGIGSIPSYSWLACLLKIIKPESLNQYLIKWVEALMTYNVKNATVSLDGKTIRSTGKMDKFTRPLHIVSAHLADQGITIG